MNGLTDPVSGATPETHERWRLARRRATCAAVLKQLPPQVIGRVVQRCWFLADRSQAQAVALAIADALENP